MITPSIRGYDLQGAGYFGAPRGDRTHKGIDFVSYADGDVIALSSGIVTKIGFPYDPGDDKKGHLLYVQITDKNGYAVRYFYVDPIGKVGTPVLMGSTIGLSQDLTKIYPGITQHFHFEVKKADIYCDPDLYLQGKYT